MRSRNMCFHQQVAYVYYYNRCCLVRVCLFKSNNKFQCGTWTRKPLYLHIYDAIFVAHSVDCYGLMNNRAPTKNSTRNLLDVIVRSSNEGKQARTPTKSRNPTLTLRYHSQYCTSSKRTGTWCVDTVALALARATGCLTMQPWLYSPFSRRSMMPFVSKNTD